MLDLSHNSLDEQAGLHLGPAIAANEWLDSLNLSWNHLRHKGAYSVALALKVIIAHFLTSLDFEIARITFVVGKSEANCE